jgi:hypothetical protein
MSTWHSAYLIKYGGQLHIFTFNLEIRMHLHLCWRPLRHFSSMKLNIRTWHDVLYEQSNNNSVQNIIILPKKTKLHGSSPQANYTDRLSDRRLSAKLVPTLADRGCRVVSATNPHGR